MLLSRIDSRVVFSGHRTRNYVQVEETLSQVCRNASTQAFAITRESSQDSLIHKSLTAQTQRASFISTQPLFSFRNNMEASLSTTKCSDEMNGYALHMQLNSDFTEVGVESENSDSLIKLDQTEKVSITDQDDDVPMTFPQRVSDTSSKFCRN